MHTPDRIGPMLRRAMNLEAIEMDIDPGNTALTGIRERTGRHRKPGRLARRAAQTSKKPSDGRSSEG